MKARSVISRFRTRKKEADKDKRLQKIFRDRMRFEQLFKWLNSRKATVIYPETKEED